MKEKNEEQIKRISQVPMLSFDGEEIVLNKVLYTSYYEGSYSWKGKSDIHIKAYRVISINQSDRCFRIRCMKGCEQLVSLNGICDTKEYYGDLKKAHDSLIPKFEKDLKKHDEKIKSVTDSKNKLEKCFLDFKKDKLKDLKIPKEIKL